MIDREELIGIYLDGFENDSLEFATLFVENAKEENIFCHIENGEIASAGYIIEKEAQLFGKTVILHYLSALSTKKEYRGKGKIGIIIKNAFEKLYKRGVAFAFLNPFNPTYYKRYGFCDITFSEKCIIEGGKKYTIRETTKADIEAMCRIELLNSNSFDNFLIKNKSEMQKLLDSFSVDNVPCNLICENDSELAFYFCFGDRIEYYAEIQQGLLREVNALKGKEFDSYYFGSDVYIQARIIDAKKALQECSYKLSDGVYKFVITDSFFEKNNSEILLNISLGKATLLENKTANIDDSFEYEIAELCKQMFLGSKIFRKQSCLFKDKF